MLVPTRNVKNYNRCVKIVIAFVNICQLIYHAVLLIYKAISANEFSLLHFILENKIETCQIKLLDTGYDLFDALGLCTLPFFAHLKNKNDTRTPLIHFWLLYDTVISWIMSKSFTFMLVCWQRVEAGSHMKCIVEYHWTCKHNIFHLYWERALHFLMYLLKIYIHFICRSLSAAVLCVDWFVYLGQYQKKTVLPETR